MEIYFLRGDAFRMNKYYKTAIDDFSLIIKMEPLNGKAYYKRGINYYFLMKKGKACRDLKHSGELGYFPAYEVISKICKKNKKGK